MQKTDTDSSRSTVTSTGNPDEVALLPLLDIDAANKAILFILDKWKNQTMTAGEREGWVEVLTLMRKGELTRALAARTDDKSYRPLPYAILEIVNQHRATDARIWREARDRKAQEQRRAEMSAPISTGAHAEAEKVFSAWEHIMPSRRNRVPA